MVGTLIGVLPGIGPVATIAMLLPTTYALQPVSALIMLAGIYYGAQYGSSTRSCSTCRAKHWSAVTCLDGHQMALKGQAGTALATAALQVILCRHRRHRVLATVAIPLSIALKFGPAEYFSLMVLGLIAQSCSHTVAPRAIAMIVLGLTLASSVPTSIPARAICLWCPGADQRSRCRQRGDGLVRICRNYQRSRIQQSVRSSPARWSDYIGSRRNSSRKHGRPLRTQYGPRLVLRLLPGGRRHAGVVRFVRAGKEGRKGSRANSARARSRASRDPNPRTMRAHKRPSFRC